MAPSRAHIPYCVVYCVGFHSGPTRSVVHACWCRDGGLSFGQFGFEHPEWLSMPCDEWFETEHGRAWQADMEGAIE